jgi:hypothetical protein
VNPIEFSWSEIKTFQRCPKQHEYKYVQGLVPKQRQRPLFLGSWVHAALESYYKQGDWKIGYKEYLDQYNKLMKEEQDLLNRRSKGTLPELVVSIIKSYLWYYREESWKILAVEEKFKVTVTFGGLKFTIKGIIDLVIEDENGDIWVIDHKTASAIPDPTSFHAMDPQLMIYPWATKQVLDLEPRGIIYNYIQSKAPTVPQLLKNGGISKRKVRTDYPTLVRFLKASGQDLADWVGVLRPLKRRSPFLRRYKLPREPQVTKEILRDVLTVATHIAQDKHRSRTITRDCARMCSFHDLCRNELNGMDTTLQRQVQFTLREEEESKWIEPEDEGGEGD